MLGDLTKRKGAPRRTVNFTARIETPTGQRVCIIVDRSHRGAKIAINPYLHLADCFALEIQPGYFVPARVGWLKGDHVGIRLEESGWRADGQRD